MVILSEGEEHSKTKFLGGWPGGVPSFVALIPAGHTALSAAIPLALVEQCHSPFQNNEPIDPQRRLCGISASIAAAVPERTESSSGPENLHRFAPTRSIPGKSLPYFLQYCNELSRTCILIR